MNNGVQWIVQPQWMVAYPAIVQHPGVNVVNAGDVVKVATRFIQTIKRAIDEYESTYRRVMKLPPLPSPVQPNAVRHEFVVVDDKAVMKSIMGGEKFTIVLPFDKGWVGSMMKMRMIPPETTRMKEPPKMVRLVWNRLNFDEVIEARALFFELVNGGRRPFRINGEKWIPVREFPVDEQECLLAEPTKSKQRLEPKSDLLSTPLVAIWREVKKLQDEFLEKGLTTLETAV